ncbi:ABC transporter substrate-binding protein [uncultured Ferrovibrio sp.]|jgi:NitT/TauT family transport system substrate-binding protein|uniref:ABC transporter substrate-binding protein n=1 Tax=uncultured Ferrovibrio sp. TaxID=1576913 RepID=UPI00261FA618|nr:ABC transporter substrate-binding protein [uncultured Ferrovibrio sp.]
MVCRFRHLMIAALGLTGLLSVSAHAADQVTYLLPAPAARPAFGPWTIAQYRGYYEKEGLSVTFQTAKGGVDVAKQVGAGNAQIGGALGDTPILVRPNGIAVKAVALLGGRGVTQLILHEDSPIKGPADLKGKTVTVLSYQDTTFYALLGMLASANLTKNDLDIHSAGPSGIWQLFLSNKADAMAAVPDYIGYVTEAKGKIRAIPGDTYFQSMAQAIVASDDLIKTNPQLIRRIVRATLRGMQDIMKNPAEAAADFVKATPENNGREATVKTIFEYYATHVYPGQQVLGAIDPERMAKLQDFYVSEGVVREKSPVEALFTNQFVTEER